MATEMEHERINRQWPTGMSVRVVGNSRTRIMGRRDDGTELLGEVRGNRVYATDCGALVRLDTGPIAGEVDIVHWLDLEQIERPVDDGKVA